jgi:hypothetical protein
MLLAEADWTQISELRKTIEANTPTSVEAAAQRFANIFAQTFESIVLARVFIVLPFAELPSADQEFAMKLVGNDSKLNARTPVLSLLGTSGREEDWNHRRRSAGHLAIPLLKSVVAAAPMIAKLLADLELDHAELDDGFASTTHKMLGANNGKFFVPNARTAVDSRNRPVIPGRDFVEKHKVQTVFGMGGSYFDGVLAVVIFFTDEDVDKLAVDRFASFISTFKTVTTRLQQKRLIYANT